MTDDQFLGVAASILDGAPVSWETLPDPVTEAERGFLTQLRLLDHLTRAHHEAQSPVGKHWGPLLVVQRIGSGTFGDVYKARDAALDRDIGLKLLRSPHAGRHLAEGRLLARVRHPNVVTVHGAAEHDGVPGIWMEFIQGRTLAQLVAEHGPFAPAPVTTIGSAVCRALAAVHASELLHGDIKAQNVMREDGGRIVLMDFGTGRIAGEVPPADALAGTPLYIAPEVLNGERPDASSDLYGVGVLLYFLLTGAFPVEGRSLAEVRAAHASGTRTAVRDRRPDVPRRLAAAIDRATAPTKAARFQTAADLATAITESATTRRWVQVAAVAVVSAAIATGSWMLAARRSTPATATIAPATPPSVMVIPFENNSRDRTSDGLVEFAIERDLLNAGWLNPVPRDRVDDALRLMRLPPDARLDAALGRQVALRDGGIDAMLTGRIDSLGPVLSLSASLTRPSDGRLIVAVTEQANGPTELMAAVHRLSDRVTRALSGQPVVGLDGPGLQRVTTPSLDALRLYSESYELGRKGRWAAARELASQAVANDASFASGWIWLAWTERNTQSPKDEVIEAAARALDLAGNVTEPERLWIVGSYHFMVTNDEEKAAAAYEALLKLRPADHVARDWALGNLAMLLSSLGRSRDALPYLLQSADARPWNARVNWSAANALLETDGDASVVRDYADRILKLDDQDPAPNQATYQSWARTLPMYERIRAGDIAGAVAIHRQLLDEVERAADPGSEELASAIVSSALFFGRVAEARRANARAAAINDPALYEALIDYYAGDDASAKRRLVANRKTFGLTLSVEIWLRARLGDITRGEQVLRQNWITASRTRQAEEGGLAIAGGDTAKGIRLIEEALPRLSPGGPYYRAVEVLATEWLRRGEADPAIAILKQASARRAFVYHPLMPFSPFWVRNEVLLAEAYAQATQYPEARQTLDGLRRLLAFADPEFPLLARLRWLEQQLP